MARNQLVGGGDDREAEQQSGTRRPKAKTTTKVYRSAKRTKLVLCCFVICCWSNWHSSASFEIKSHENAADSFDSSSSSSGGISNKLNRWPVTVDSDNNNNSDSDDISDDTDIENETRRVLDAVSAATSSAYGGTTKGRLTSNRQLMSPANGTLATRMSNPTDSPIDFDQLVDDPRAVNVAAGREPISAKRVMFTRDIKKALEADAKVVAKALEADAKIIKSVELKKIKKKIKKKLKALDIDKLRAELEVVFDHAIHYTAPLYDDTRVHYDGFVQQYHEHYNKPATEVAVSASKSVVKRDIIEAKVMKKAEKKVRKKVKKLKHTAHNTFHHAVHAG